MDDAGCRGDHGEVVKCLLAPFEEFVAFIVTFEFLFGVDGQCNITGKGVDLHGVVDDQVAGDQGIDLGCVGLVTRHADNTSTHGSKIDHRRHAGEVLEDHATGHEGDFDLADVLGIVVGQGFDVFGRVDVFVDIAEHRFEEHLDGVRQLVDLLAEGAEVVNGLLTQRGLNCLFCGFAGVCHMEPLDFGVFESGYLNRARRKS